MDNETFSVKRGYPEITVFVLVNFIQHVSIFSRQTKIRLAQAAAGFIVAHGYQRTSGSHPENSFAVILLQV